MIHKAKTVTITRDKDGHYEVVANGTVVIDASVPAGQRLPRSVANLILAFVEEVLRPHEIWLEEIT